MQFERRGTTWAIKRLSGGHDGSQIVAHRHLKGAKFAKKTKPKQNMCISTDMTPPRSAGHRPKAVWHYIFRYASDVAAPSICLAKCPLKRCSGPTEADRQGSKMTRRQKNVWFLNIFFFSARRSDLKFSFDGYIFLISFFRFTIDPGRRSNCKICWPHFFCSTIHLGR